MKPMKRNCDAEGSCDALVAESPCGASPQVPQLRGALAVKHPHPARPTPPAPGGEGAAGTTCDEGVAATVSRLLIALLLLFLSLASARAQFTITPPEVLSETRIDRTHFDYAMRVKIANSGPTTAGITATVTSTSARTVPGLIHFGTVLAAASTPATDTFTIRHDRTVPFDPAVLTWTIHIPFTVWNYFPQAGASEVGVTVRPQVFFSQPVDVTTLTAANFYATFSGQKLPATIVPANDGRFAWLIFTAPMPGASQVQVTVEWLRYRRGHATQAAHVRICLALRALGSTARAAEMPVRGSNAASRRRSRRSAWWSCRRAGCYRVSASTLRRGGRFCFRGGTGVWRCSSR